MIHGCSQLGAFYRVVLSLALPGLVVVIAMSFISGRDEFFLARTLIAGLSSGAVKGWQQLPVRRHADGRHQNRKPQEGVRLGADHPRYFAGRGRWRVRRIGRAFVRNPQVFLFDEPLSNLDAKLRVSMRAEIKELHQRLKVTTVYVTHDQVEAMTMADKIVVMRGGHIEQVGRPLDLYDRPANRFVAGFIGSPGMNFLEGVLASDLSGRVRFTSRNGLVIPLDDAGAALRSDVTVIGVRPEHISPRSEEANGHIPMTVAVVEPTGNETTLLLRSGRDELVVVRNGRHAFQPGETVWAGFDNKMLHFFDGKDKAVAQG